MIEARCQCGRVWRVADKHAGRRAKCPSCGQELRVPGAKIKADVPPSPEAERREDQPTPKYYRHSGKVGLASAFLVLCFGTIAAIVLGFVYGYATYYIPLIIVSFFLSFLFGIAVGFAVLLAAWLGKIRSTGIALLDGLAFGVFADYVGWVVWLHAGSGHSVWVLSPLEILGAIKTLATENDWTIGRFGRMSQITLPGELLYVRWALEFIIVVGASSIVALAGMSSVPFCERCGQWATTAATISNLHPINNPDELRSQLEQGNYASLLRLPKAGLSGGKFTEAELLCCDSCHEFCCLTVTSVEVTVDSDGDEKKSERAIVRNLMISPSVFLALQKHLGKPDVFV
jgi:hypothetical protein